MQAIKQYSDHDQIESAIDNGIKVYWKNKGYIVIKDSLDQYLIQFMGNGSVTGIYAETPGEFFSERDDIKAQWGMMLSKNIMPVMEYELTNGEYITVQCSFDHAGIIFDVDYTGDIDSLDVRFSGSIQEIGFMRFIQPFDEYFSSLDYYLQEIGQEITEGLLIPSDLQEIM